MSRCRGCRVVWIEWVAVMVAGHHGLSGSMSMIEWVDVNELSCLQGVKLLGKELRRD